MKKHPWYKFWATIWLSDPHVKQCKWEHKGLLTDLMAIAHDGTPRGTVTNGGLPLSVKEIAKTFGERVTKAEKLVKRLQELNRIGIKSDESGETIYIPSMVLETEQVDRAQQDGLKGGNPNLKKTDKGKVKGTVNLDVEEKRRDVEEKKGGITPPKKEKTAAPSSSGVKPHSDLPPTDARLKRPCPSCINKPGPESQHCPLCKGSGSLFIGDDDYQSILQAVLTLSEERGDDEAHDTSPPPANVAEASSETPPPANENEEATPENTDSEEEYAPDHEPEPAEPVEPEGPPPIPADFKQCRRMPRKGERVQFLHCDEKWECIDGAKNLCFKGLQTTMFEAMSRWGFVFQVLRPLTKEEKAQRSDMSFYPDTRAD
jgi:hypothetical protein